MKKIVALLLAGLMAASLVGCNNGSTESGSASDTNASVSSGSTADDSWEKIQANGKIIMGVDDEFPPMGYIDTQTGEEVRPVLYTDEITGKIKGRCKILPNRPYIVLELRFEDEEKK